MNAVLCGFAKWHQKLVQTFATRGPLKQDSNGMPSFSLLLVFVIGQPASMPGVLKCLLRDRVLKYSSNNEVQNMGLYSTLQCTLYALYSILQIIARMHSTVHSYYKLAAS